MEGEMEKGNVIPFPVGQVCLPAHGALSLLILFIVPIGAFLLFCALSRPIQFNFPFLDIFGPGRVQSENNNRKVCNRVYVYLFSIAPPLALGKSKLTRQLTRRTHKRS